MKDKERKSEIEGLLNTKLTEERYALLVNFGKKISDWSNEEKTQNEGRRSIHCEKMKIDDRIDFCFR